MHPSMVRAGPRGQSAYIVSLPGGTELLPFPACLLTPTVMKSTELSNGPGR
jgi:hypothetical protein